MEAGLEFKVPLELAALEESSPEGYFVVQSVVDIPNLSTEDCLELLDGLLLSVLADFDRLTRPHHVAAGSDRNNIEYPE